MFGFFDIEKMLKFLTVLQISRGFSMFWPTNMVEGLEGLGRSRGETKRRERGGEKNGGATFDRFGKFTTSKVRIANWPGAEPVGCNSPGEG